MKRIALTLFLALSGIVTWAQEINPQAVVDLCNRVCGEDAASHFTFVVDDNMDGCARYFSIEAADGKVQLTANDRSSLCCALNWYLNHTAHVNIAWNNLTQTVTDFPLPAAKETHSTFATWSYYLNYCTFSYSMAVWDEERWMQEIDWMALHGVNLPLQAVGIDAVWYYMLRDEFGFSHAEATSFIAGPAFQGWWLMNNLTGHGGPNPEWWYERQAALGKKITDRMRSLGMSPCLPGFVGMAPQKYVNDTGVKSYSGSWCGFTSPLLIAPGEAFDRMARQYYIYINKVFGFLPESYSMDPVHERGLPGGMGQDGYKALCDAARNAMNEWGCEGDTKPLWVAQEWQVNADIHRINALSDDNTLLLDLSSERLTYKARYGNKNYLFCMLHNYGGNIGMYGCMKKMLQEYEGHLQTGHANRAATGVSTSSAGFICGVGATPEGIETNPMLYDLLFELPWYSEVPDAQAWLREYTVSRYGIESEHAQLAWLYMLETVYDNTNSNQQGCREPVFCARPNLTGNGASSWANASYHWDKQKVIDAAFELLAMLDEDQLSTLNSQLSTTNYIYDLIDFTRQALTDHAHTMQMDLATLDPKSEQFAQRADNFLALMDDIDQLLGTVEDFRLGRWTGMARSVAVNAGHPEYADWMERNARMLITTWGDSYAATNNGGLRDYGNREWQGLITGYYRPRWVAYFNDMKTKGSCSITASNWFDNYERKFVYGETVKYGSYGRNAATGDPIELSRKLMKKYFGTGETLSFEYQGWTFTASTMGLDLTLLDAEGEGAVTIPETIEIDGTRYTIVAIGKDFLRNNASATSVTLPATVTKLNSRLYVPASKSSETIGGNYPSKKFHWTLDRPLSKDCTWSINVAMKIGTKAFNQWGAACFAPHTAIADPTSYSGFQFYQNSSTNGDGDLHVMPEHNGVRYMLDSNTKQHLKLLGKTVLAHLEYNKGQWTLVISTTDGNSGILTYDWKLAADITHINAWVGEDSEILSVSCEENSAALTTLFACRNLTAINVAAGHPTLRSIDGALWDKSGTVLLRLPFAHEGNVRANEFCVVTNINAFTVGATKTTAKLECTPMQAGLSNGLYGSVTALLLRTQNSQLSTLNSQLTDLAWLKRMNPEIVFGQVIIDRTPMEVGLQSHTPHTTSNSHTLSKGFDDITLPFDVYGHEIADCFEAVYTPYDYGYDDSGCETPLLLVKPVESSVIVGDGFETAEPVIAAGTPYIVKMKAGAPLVFSNKKLSYTLGETHFRLYGKDDAGTFCGTLEPKSFRQGEPYATLSNGEFYTAIWQDTTLDAFRTYLKATDAGELFNCSIAVGDGTLLSDGVQTPLSQLSTLNSQLSTPHDLQGRPATPATKGILLQGNKKILRH